MDLSFISRKTIIGSSEGVVIPKNIAEELESGKKYLFVIKEIKREVVGDGKGAKNS